MYRRHSGRHVRTAYLASFPFAMRKVLKDVLYAGAFFGVCHALQACMALMAGLLSNKLGV